MSHLQVDDPPIALLQQPRFRRLQFTRFLSRVAQNALNFGLVLLIVDETGSALYSSALVLALVVPATVAGIVAGTAADHLPKRALIVFGDLMRAVVCLYFVRGSGDTATYFTVAILLATFGQFATAAEGATMPLIVKRDELARANALSQAVGTAAQLVGLAILAPVALRVFDSPTTLFSVAAVLLITAAGFAAFLGRVPKPLSREVGGELEGRWWSAGWRALKADPRAMQAATELTLIATAVIILGGLIPSYITDVLGLPVEIGALILTPAALGMALGLRIAGFLAHRVSHGLLSSVGFVSFVILLAMLAFVEWEADFLSGFAWFSWLDNISIGKFDSAGVLALILVFPLGFSYALVGVAGQTVLNDVIPLNLQGRVGATQSAMAAIAASAPVLVAGALTDAIGVVPVMAILAGSVGLVAFTSLREPRAVGAAARAES